MDTGDEKGDFMVHKYKVTPMSYAHAKDTFDWTKKHDEWDVWSFKITDEGVYDALIDKKSLLRNELYE